MKYFKFSFLIIFTFTFISCNSILLKLITSKEIKTKVFYNQEKDKTLVIFPMLHINHPEFYADAKVKLEKLRQQGYTVFLEGVALEDSTSFSSQQLDTVTRKMRKIVGYNLSNYKNKQNKSISKAIRNSKYVSESRENMGIQPEDMDLQQKTGL